MKINVLQMESEGENRFSIQYNDTLQYTATLPFVSIKDPFNLEKIREIKIFDVNGNVVYSSDYKYIENLKEEFIPMKFLVTGSQKFNQLLFLSEKSTIKIYYEENAIWNNRYVIELDGKRFFCYSIEDGYIRHFPIYEEDVQIGEALKSNVVIDAKDEYCCYLKDGYEFLADGIVALLLYLDRSEYNSSYLVNKSYTVSRSFSYNQTNKFYDREWVRNNFGDEFYKKVDAGVALVKEKMKHPIKTSIEQYNAMSEKEKRLMKLVIFGPWVMIFICAIFVLIILLFSR